MRKAKYEICDVITGLGIEQGVIVGIFLNKNDKIFYQVALNGDKNDVYTIDEDCIRKANKLCQYQNIK